MGKSYELADGSLSTDYEIGDEFVVNSRVDEQAGFSKCSIINFYRDDNSEQPLFKLIKGDCIFNNCSGDKGAFVWWFCLTPTPETKRKAQARKNKLTINSGDYIDSREFTREECERFCDLAVECGFDKSCCFSYQFRFLGVSENAGRIDTLSEGFFTNNITTQFREFLDKEKGVKKFTKADLRCKQGATVLHRNGANTKVLTDELLTCFADGEWVSRMNIFELSEDLSLPCNSQYDIMRVTDRDGTVLFEREEEPRELTIEEIAKAFNLPVERVRIKK